MRMNYHEKLQQLGDDRYIICAVKICTWMRWKWCHSFPSNWCLKQPFHTSHKSIRCNHKPGQRLRQWKTTNAVGYQTISVHTCGSPRLVSTPPLSWKSSKVARFNTTTATKSLNNGRQYNNENNVIMHYWYKPIKQHWINLVHRLADQDVETWQDHYVVSLHIYEYSSVFLSGTSSEHMLHIQFSSVEFSNF